MGTLFPRRNYLLQRTDLPDISDHPGPGAARVREIRAGQVTPPQTRSAAYLLNRPKAVPMPSRLTASMASDPGSGTGNWPSLMRI